MLALPLLLALVAAALGAWLLLRGESPAPSAAPEAAAGAGARAVPSPTPHPRLTYDADPPDITARAAAVLEEPCAALLHDHNARQQLPPASLTKILTALVVAERADPAELVSVRVSGFELAETTDSTVMGLEPGQVLSVRDLLYGLLLVSGTDAAITLAEHVGGTVPAFVDLMNQKAQQLGLIDSHFANPHGLHNLGLYSTALDIALLGRELLRQPLLAEIVSTQEYQPDWDGPPLSNINHLLGLYPGAIGVKTGYTDEAGQTFVAAAERNGRRVIVSLLDSEDLFVDAIALLDWAFSSVPPACEAPDQSGTSVADR